MIKVFRNNECAHVWAQRNQEEGRTNNGNMFFTSDTIYSYGYHFPIAHFNTYKGVNICLINTDTVSSSTSKHQQNVRQAINYRDYKMIPLKTEQMKSLIHALGCNGGIKRIIKNVCKDHSIQFYQYLIKAGKARTRTVEYLREASNIKENVVNLCAFFKCYVPKWALQSDNELVTLSKDLSDKDKERLKRNKLKHDKEKTLQISEWLANERKDIHWNYRPTQVIMRVNGDNVDTSQGASFPVNHAKKAFSVILNCKQTAQKFIKNGSTIHLGHYQIDAIHENGDIEAGCHFVPYTSIEVIAKQLKLI